MKLAVGAYSASAISYFFIACSVPLPSAGAGVCARRRSDFLLSRQEKVTKEKATLHAASLRFAAGNLRCSRPAGSRSNSLHCVALRQSRALIRWPLRSSAHREGNPGNRTSTRAFAALGPQHAGAARRDRQAERSDGPNGCLLPTPSGCAWGAQGAGWRVCRRTYPLRQLTRRGCLNGAPQARSEFHGAPRTRAPQVAGYWGQTPISLRCAAPHPPGEPKAR